MSERVTEEQIRQAIGLPGDSQSSTHLRSGLRIDQPHPPLFGRDPRDVATETNRANETSDAIDENASREIGKHLEGTPARDVGRLDIRFLSEASQLAQQLHLQLQSQQDALDERERGLRDRQAAFDAEKNSFIQQIAHELEQLERQKDEFQQSAAELAERQSLLESQARQIDTERDLIQLERVDLNQRAVTLRSEVLAEFESERSEFDRLKASLREEQDRVQLLKAWLQKRLDELAAENERTLQSEREKLWQSLTTEWEQRQTEFQQEKDAWITTRDLEKSEIEREKALFESTVNSANTEFLAAREALAIELSQLQQEHARLLEAEKQDWEQTRQRQESEIAVAKEAVDTQNIEAREAQARALQTERNAWDEAWRTEEAELYAARESLKAELAAAREAHLERLRAERSEWEKKLNEEKTALANEHAEAMRERTLIENRIRFQQEHLEKSRAEFELAQNQHRYERQVERQRIEEAELLMVRRLRQIDLYRASIDEREKSLDREEELFQRTQKSLSSTVDLDRLNLQAEREAWQTERDIQQSEIRRQKEALSALSEGLESRRVRLDKLRAELEETHRATLEMRLAVEEAWAQLTQVAGQDDARQRVEQVRESLVGYYQQMHESFEEQRRDQFEALSKLERQRLEFAEERQKLTSWITARDEELKSGEDRLRVAETQAAASNANWMAARDRWLLEKAEAEKLIRRLLASNGELSRNQSRDTETVFALTPREAAVEDIN
jgi:hypothetical protein